MTSPSNATYRQYTDTGTGTWLISFADLLLLLITAFVLRLSMSELPNTRMPLPASTTGAIVDATMAKENLQVHAAGAAQQASTTGDDADALLDQRHPLIGLWQRSLEQLLKGTDSLIVIDEDISNKQRLLRVVIPVAAGSVEGTLSFSAKESLQAISQTVSATASRITVESHLATTGISLDQGSKWDRSASLALLGVRQLVDGGVERSTISVASYADSKTFRRTSIRPWLHQNSRIEVVIEPID